tara:strand:+ start:43 stop:399 length:357 start_codon:yes stop_codon:yes gene_type:complete
MTQPNEALLENVKTWLNIDNEIRALQKEIRNRRKLKKDLTEELVGIMKNHDIEQVNIPDGQLIYTKHKIKAPLSKKHLLSSLSNYFSNDPRIVAELSKYIMETRQIKEKENIRRKIKK